MRSEGKGREERREEIHQGSSAGTGKGERMWTVTRSVFRETWEEMLCRCSLVFGAQRPGLQTYFRE